MADLLVLKAEDFEIVWDEADKVRIPIYAVLTPAGRAKLVAAKVDPGTGKLVLSGKWVKNAG